MASFFFDVYFIMYITNKIMYNIEKMKGNTYQILKDGYVTISGNRWNTGI